MIYILGHPSSEYTYPKEHQRYQTNRYARRILQQNYCGTGRLDNKKKSISNPSRQNTCIKGAATSRMTQKVQTEPTINRSASLQHYNQITRLLDCSSLK